MSLYLQFKFCRYARWIKTYVCVSAGLTGVSQHSTLRRFGISLARAAGSGPMRTVLSAPLRPALTHSFFYNHLVYLQNCAWKNDTRKKAHAIFQLFLLCQLRTPVQRKALDPLLKATMADAAPSLI